MLKSLSPVEIVPSRHQGRDEDIHSLDGSASANMENRERYVSLRELLVRPTPTFSRRNMAASAEPPEREAGLNHIV